MKRILTIIAMAAALFVSARAQVALSTPGGRALWAPETGPSDGQVLRYNMGTGKTAWFSTVDNTAYDATTWDGVTNRAPSMNAVRDKIESLVLGGGGLTSSDIDTLAELNAIVGDANLVPEARTLTAGVGLSGGGDLSADRTFTLDLSELVNNQTIFDSANASRTITFGLSGSTDPVLTLGDNSFDLSTGVLKQGGTAVALQSRSISTGAGLSGGGDLSSDRTLTLNLAGLVNNQTLWDSANATRTLTAGLSGSTDPVITFGDNSVDVTTGVLKQGGVAVTTASSTDTFSNKTFDAANTGNVLKMKGYIQLMFPHLCDGAGAVIYTNDYTQVYYGHALFSGSAATNANFVEYRVVVPEDLDTSVDLKVSRWKVRLNGADTSASTYNIGMADVTDSSSASGGSIVNWVAMAVSADASGASGDIETASNVTLTSWRSSLTPGHLWVIRVNRDGANDTSNVAHYDAGLVIEYGVTQ